MGDFEMEDRPVLKSFDDAEIQSFLDEVSYAESGQDVLSLTWKLLFGVDLADPDLEQVKPWDYHISAPLSQELIDFSVDVLKEPADAVGFLWLNWSPSMKNDLERHQIRVPEDSPVLS